MGMRTALRKMQEYERRKGKGEKVITNNDING